MSLPEALSTHLSLAVTKSIQVKFFSFKAFLATDRVHVEIPPE